MSYGIQDLYEFYDFRLDIAERILQRDGGERVPLPEKAFDTLCALVRRAGRLASKGDLLAEVWTDAIVEENNLDKNISYLRRALGEKKDVIKFIETVRGHGYRFVAEVRRIENLGCTAIKENAEKSGIWNLESEHSQSQKSETENQPINPKSEIRNPKSNNVVALALWRREAEDTAIEEIGEAANVETKTRLVPAIFQPTKTERTAPAESLPPAPTGIKFPGNRFAVAAFVLIAALIGIGYSLFRFFNRAPIEFRADNLKVWTTTGKSRIAAVSADGKYLAYVQETNDRQSLWVRQVAAENNVQILPPADVKFRGLNFTPDGRQVLFTRSGEKSGVYRVSIDGGEATLLFGGAALAPVASPDGKQIAFYLSKGKQSQIAVIPFGGGKPPRRFDAPMQSVADFPSPSLQWTPDGRAVNYIVTRDDVSNIWRQPIGGGQPVQITNFTTDRIFNFSFSPDGSRLALSRDVFNSDVVLIENAAK